MIKDYGALSFYEIYPVSFKDSNGDGVGDIQGIIEKLDYVKSLGFSGIWVNPFYKSPFLDGGYDIEDPFHVDPRFGTDEDARKLIEACHARNIAIFFDLVPGHLSWSAPQFLQSAAAQRNDLSDMFIWSDNPWGWYGNCAGNLVRGLFPRYGSFFVNFFVHQPALNYGFNRVEYPQWQISYRDERVVRTRKFLISIMERWLKLGVDGFRVDMADSLVKNDEEKEATIWLWQQIIAEVQKECGKFYMVSEWSTPRRSLKAGFSSDFVLDHDDNFSHGFFRIGTLDRPDEAGKKPLLDSFDEELWQKNVAEMVAEIRDAEKVPGGYLSPISGNHDTYRIADRLKGNKLKLAYLMLFTIPGVPFVFAGDECEQTTVRGYPSKDGGYQRTGARLSMKWDESTPSFGFSTRASADCYLPTCPETRTVERCEKDPASLLNFIRQLNAVRSSDPDLTAHEGFELLSAPLSFRRGKTVVLINLKDEEASLPVGSGRVLLQVGEAEFTGNTIRCGGHSGIVFQED